MNFPKDFVWGVSTAAYQIEGGLDQDNKQETIWDSYANDLHRTQDGFSGSIACDHYHHMEEDLDLIKDLGVKNYRFSTAWSRVLSYESEYGSQAVKGIVNQKGLDFYKRLVDGLLERGITPWLTLYHWDLPLELQRKGGFSNRDIHNWISDYTDLMTRTFGDKIKNFMTLNEMPCILGGYQGWMAPGLVVSRREMFNAMHNILLCHGSMTRTIRANVKDAKIGFAHNGCAPYPASDDPKDIAAWNKACECLEMADNDYAPQKGTGKFWTDNPTYWCDAIHLGKYPEKAFKIFADSMPVIKDGDMELISTPVDFHGQNLYEGCAIAAGSKENADDDGFHKVHFAQGNNITAAKWPITPQAMRYFMNFLYNRYKKPIYLTENGMSGADVVCLDGKVHDEYRIDYTTRYLTELSKAIQDGSDIRGYFHWSLLDNFEWSHGYTERFGLVHVDYTTQKRTPKESYYWFKDLVSK
ncbi:MAG: family 1 glycosylhydrolase [Treponema sp.]|nr:family 1 glycosylhydrolase [Treponema sp.]